MNIKRLAASPPSPSQEPSPSPRAPPTKAAPPTTERLDLSGTLVGGGASSQDAAQEAWVAGFQTANPDVTIDYDPAGSGAGREMFIAGGERFAGSDRAFKRRGARRRRASRACAAGHRRSSSCPPTSPRSPSSSTSRASTTLNLDAGDDRRHLQGRHHQLERRGDRRAEPGRQLPTWRSPPCTAPTTRAPPRTSPTT